MKGWVSARVEAEDGAQYPIYFCDTARLQQDLDELTAQNQRALRQQMLDQSKTINDELRRKYEELAASIAREAGELRHDKTDRAALADLFTEVALRLNNQFHIPGE